MIIVPPRGPSCKLKLARLSVKLKFQDGPSVAIYEIFRSQCPLRCDRAASGNDGIREELASKLVSQRDYNIVISCSFSGKST